MCVLLMFRITIADGTWGKVLTVFLLSSSFYKWKDSVVSKVYPELRRENLRVTDL